MGGAIFSLCLCRSVSATTSMGCSRMRAHAIEGGPNEHASPGGSGARGMDAQLVATMMIGAYPSGQCCLCVKESAWYEDMRYGVWGGV